ncbi:MAG: hypothetical protein L7F77_10415, partial [Candidatus Magnetominusculus sp. LBB02]|nr:hypothetical protein [Candidatus Magnetominusculus sp. LBB02]
MSYTIAESLGMRSRRLDEIIPAEKLAMLEPIMKEWAGKLYKSFDAHVDKDKIGEHIKWIYAMNNYQRPRIVYTYNPEVYKSLAAKTLLEKKDSVVSINMRNQLCTVVKTPLWFSVNTESEVTYAERFQAPFKHMMLGLPFRNSKEFGQMMRQRRSGASRAVSEDCAYPTWMRHAQQDNIFNGAGLWADSAWFFLFDYISAIGVRKNEAIGRYRAYLQSGVLASTFFENTAVVLIQPIVTKLTADSQLHCDGDAAIQWRDGCKTFLLHNVPVPEHIAVTHHNQLDPALVLTTDAQIRREIVRKIGIDRVIAHFG